MNKLKVLEKRRQELEEMIRDTKKRLPAHSTKPPVMMELLDLEDEYDELMDKIKNLKKA